MSASVIENATPLPLLAGRVPGLEYFDPKPALQGYACTNGDEPVTLVTAMSEPAFENATSLPLLAGRVPGLDRFVPKPELHGYVETNGVVVCATAMSELVKATPCPLPAGRVPGLDR